MTGPRLYLKNLPHRCPTDELTNQLSLAFKDTNFKTIRLALTGFGKFRGFAFVEFFNEEDRLVALNTVQGIQIGTTEKRIMSVELASSPVRTMSPNEWKTLRLKDEEEIDCSQSANREGSDRKSKMLESEPKTESSWSKQSHNFRVPGEKTRGFRSRSERSAFQGNDSTERGGFRDDDSTTRRGNESTEKSKRFGGSDFGAKLRAFRSSDSTDRNDSTEKQRYRTSYPEQPQKYRGFQDNDLARGSKDSIDKSRGFGNDSRGRGGFQNDSGFRNLNERDRYKPDSKKREFSDAQGRREAGFRDGKSRGIREQRFEDSNRTRFGSRSSDDHSPSDFRATSTGMRVLDSKDFIGGKEKKWETRPVNGFQKRNSHRASPKDARDRNQQSKKGKDRSKE